MNGAILPVFLIEVNEANPVFYLYFKQKKGNIAKIFCSVIYN